MTVKFQAISSTIFFKKRVAHLGVPHVFRSLRVVSTPIFSLPSIPLSPCLTNYYILPTVIYPNFILVKSIPLHSFSRLISSLILCLTIKLLAAQPQLISYDDAVYRDYIRSVRMHVTGLALTQPVSRLGSRESLTLSFDELDGQGTRYYYTAIHCDRNWQPTQELSPFEYLGGYREGEMRDYAISTAAYQSYLHYSIAIPNDELNWSLSGNYLLVVYEGGHDHDPILTRRFLVTEEKVAVFPKLAKPADVSKQTTHHEIDFILETAALPSFNPRMDFYCTILQNGRWDNSLREIVPRNINGSLLDYNYQDKITFEAGKEFRFLDISSMLFRSENVLNIEEHTDGYSIVLLQDQPRARQAYLWQRDINGMFVPFNRDYYRKRVPPDSLASTLNLVDRYNYREQQLNTEYVEVIFNLNHPELAGTPIFIVGGMTDWKMLPEYQLTWDDRVGSYLSRLYLKQGYYNYAYAIPDRYGHPDFSFIEGNWFGAENQYSILVYFRPRGGLYDQLVGVHGFNSLD